MRLRETAAPFAAATALFVSGCHNEEPPPKTVEASPAATQPASPDTTHSAPPETTQPPPEINPIEEWNQAMSASLNEFRNRVLSKEQVEIALGSCVVWANDTNDLTITLNPGIGRFKSSREEYDYFIFSGHNPHYNPDWGPLNGPEVGSEDVVTYVFKPDKPVQGGLLRVLSDEELRGKNGQRYYKDKQTGLPVMNTVLIKAPTTSKHIADVCEALELDKPIPASDGSRA